MEQLTKLPKPDPQAELLKSYCAEAETLIMTASSEEEAKVLGRQLCSKFRGECSSALVVNATEKYIDNIISRTFQNRNEQDRTSNEH